MVLIIALQIHCPFLHLYESLYLLIPDNLNLSFHQSTWVILSAFIWCHLYTLAIGSKVWLNSSIVVVGSTIGPHRHLLHILDFL